MPTPLVSVIIPCYKQAHLLPQAIQSCIDQTFPNIEIIVVDDGSPDDVPLNISSFKSRVKLIRQPNMGLSAARNTGIRHAEGDFLKFLDADDWLLPECIDLQVKSIQNLKNYISVIGFEKWYEDAERVSDYIYPEYGRLNHALCYVNIGPPHIYLFPTEIVRKIAGFDQSERVHGGHEDYDLLCRIAAEGFNAVTLHTIGCVYRQSADSMSTQLSKMSSTRKKVWQNYTQIVLAEEVDIEFATHLLGGYALRVASRDIHYEAVDILKKIAMKIEALEDDISSELALKICRSIALIRKFMHGRIEPEEKLPVRQTSEILDHLTSLCIAKINNTDILKEEYVVNMLSLAKTHLLADRRYLLRRFVGDLEDRALAAKWLKAFFAVIKLPTYFFNPHDLKKNKSKTISN